MNLGKSVKKLASEFNVVFSLYKSAGVCKTNASFKTLEELRRREIFRIPYSASINNLDPDSLYNPSEEKWNSIIKNDTKRQRKIEEPDKIIKIKIKLPVENLTKFLDLPCSVEREIQEPVKKIISKRANRAHINSINEIKKMHIVNIRRRKMRVHKRKKYMKKHRIELMKRKAERKLQKEFNFQMQLKGIIKECESYNPEQYMKDTLKTIHWQRPVTRVKGILAPQFVIKDYLNKKQEEKMLQERLEECINSRK